MKERFAVYKKSAGYFRLPNLTLQQKLLFGALFLLLLISCSKIPKNNVEDVVFSYKTYVKESEDGAEEPFDREAYQLVDNLDLKFFRGSIWTELCIVNNGIDEKTVIVANDDRLNLNYRLYELDTVSNDLELVYDIGHFDNIDARSFRYSKPNFKITLEPLSNKCYFIQSSCDGRIVQTTPFISTLDNYFQLMNNSANQNIFFFTSLFIIFLINLFFWRSFRNKIHGYYSSYVLLTLILYAGFEGYLFDQGIDVYFIDHLMFLILRGSLLCLIFFTAFFLKIDELAPRIFKVVKRTAISMVLLLTAYQFLFFNSSIRYLHELENMVSFVWMSSILLMLWASLRQKRPELKYYLVALFSYILFIVLGLIAPHIDLFNQFGIEFYSLFKIGVLVEVIIFTYTIVKVIGITEKEQKKENEEIKITRENIESENKELKNQIKNSNMQKMEFLSILKLIESNLNNDEEWTIFKDKVNEVNPNFLKKLQETHQNLSKNDLRLLLLVKLGFTQKEIAGMLFIAEGSVKKSKQRVRKKLSLSAEVTLSEYLSNF